MRVWTIQPQSLYEKLQNETFLHCDPSKSEHLMDWGFQPAYDWLVEQMIKRVGLPPQGIRYPIWAWHTLRGQHKKPDLRWMEFRNYRGIYACIELEISDRQVLLSDEEMWHMVLNDGFYGDADSEEAYEREEKWFDSLPLTEKMQVKRNSWEKIFDVFPPRDTGWDRRGEYVQATFWELRLEHVIAVRFFHGRIID